MNPLKGGVAFMPFVVSPSEVCVAVPVSLSEGGVAVSLNKGGVAFVSVIPSKEV